MPTHDYEDGSGLYALDAVHDNGVYWWSTSITPHHEYKSTSVIEMKWAARALLEQVEGEPVSMEQILVRFHSP